MVNHNFGRLISAGLLFTKLTLFAGFKGKL